MAALNEEFFSEWQPKELDLFGLNPMQTVVEKIIYQQIRPINSLTPLSSVEFVVAGNNGLQYVELKKTYLSLKIKIVHGDTGCNLLADEFVGPTNLITQSLFDQVDVTLQGKLVSTATNHYQYKSYLQKLLSLGIEGKLSQLSTQLWMKDTQPYSDDAKTGNPALVSRAKPFLQCKTVHLVSDICHNLFQMDRYLLTQLKSVCNFIRVNLPSTS